MKGIHKGNARRECNRKQKKRGKRKNSTYMEQLFFFFFFSRGASAVRGGETITLGKTYRVKKGRWQEDSRSEPVTAVRPCKSWAETAVGDCKNQSGPTGMHRRPQSIFPDLFPAGGSSLCLFICILLVIIFFFLFETGSERAAS